MRFGCLSQFGLKKTEFNDTLLRRFKSKCGAATASGCIPWTGYKTTTGYGVLRVASKGSRKTTAHRIAWVIERGDLDPEMLVLHRCDNPSCVNVEHLFLGSPKENTDDMVSKRRHAWRDGQPWQKLTAQDAARIRDLRRSGLTQQKIADQFGVSRPLISLIEHGHIQYAQSAVSL